MASMDPHNLAKSSDLATLKQLLNKVSFQIVEDESTTNGLSIKFENPEISEAYLRFEGLIINLEAKTKEYGGIELALSLLRADSNVPVQMVGFENFYVAGESGVRTPIRDSRSTIFSFRGLKPNTTFMFYSDNSEGRSDGPGGAPVTAPVSPTPMTGMEAASLPPSGVYSAEKR